MQHVYGFMDDLLLEFLKAEGVFSRNVYLVAKQNKKKDNNC